MGVTIHYGGAIRSLDMIDELVDEIVEISKANDWKYKIIDTNKQKNNSHKDQLPHLKGISFGAAKSESVWLTFNDQRKLLSPMVAMFTHDIVEEENVKYHAFTKTQFAGVEYHIKLVKILKYVSKKYFSDWRVSDESSYYETEDREQLVDCMNIIDRSMAALTDAFNVHGEDIAQKSEEEIKDFIEQVLGNQTIDVKIIKLGTEEE